MKILNDKYYTDSDLAEYCYNKTLTLIGENNIDHIIEPSAGNGVFLNLFKNKHILAIDIEPEDNRIIKADYLEYDLMYQPNTLVIGNPPFGEKNILSVKFYKKSINVADYISFILPISQLNNNQQMYEFDLIHSEDLGIRKYSDRNVHCCLNIFKKPSNTLFNKKPNNKSDIINIVESRLGNKKDTQDYDIRMVSWGSIGKILSPDDKQYAKEFFIFIKDQDKKQFIKNILIEADWKKEYPMTVTPNLLQWQVIKYVHDRMNIEVDIPTHNSMIDLSKLF